MNIKYIIYIYCVYSNQLGLADSVICIGFASFENCTLVFFAKQKFLMQIDLRNVYRAINSRIDLQNKPNI